VLPASDTWKVKRNPVGPLTQNEMESGLRVSNTAPPVLGENSPRPAPQLPEGPQLTVARPPRRPLWTAAGALLLTQAVTEAPLAASA
jgi:hypothetical protein